MGSNLAKSPLMAVYYASSLYFIRIFVPWTQDYAARPDAYTMPLYGHLFLLVFALWICIGVAIVFGSSDKRGMRVVLPIFLTAVGSLWLAPCVEPLLFGRTPGTVGLFDSLMVLASGVVCTALLLLLVLMIYKTGAHGDAKAGQKVSFKIKPLPLIIKMIILPIVFCILFFVAWYFLGWQFEHFRSFYGGNPENPGFIPSIVNVLLYDAWVLPLMLVRGLLYALCALPLMFLFPGKRIIFIVSTLFFWLGGCVWYLMPTPLLPDDVRITGVILNAALLLVYGVLTGFLLHTSFAKQVEELPPPAKAPARRAPAGPTSKQAAEALRTTMVGDV